MIKTTREAIDFLENERGTHTDDLSEFKWKIYDEDFSFSVKTDKELIDYANEQYDDVNSYGGLKMNVNEILNKLSNEEQKELFLLHHDKYDIEQWLIDYYEIETEKTLCDDIKYTKRLNMED